MAEESVDRNPHRQLLSQLVDGELEAADVRRACSLWREDADLRDRWHAYHLIGDVLRSDDLAAAPDRDESFLASLRGRLAQEPVVLAPQPAAPVAAPVRGWRRAFAAPMAVAAGFMAVAGLLVVTRLAGPQTDAVSSSLAATEAARPVAAAAPVAAGPAGSEGFVAVQDARLIRDARLDRYLSAHRQYGADSAFGVPAGSLRQAAVVVPQR